MRPLLHIGTDTLTLDSVAASLGDGAGADGAVVTFLGLVRNHNLGRSVRYLEYEAYEAAGAQGVRADCRGNRRAVAGRAARAASPHRPSADRRGEHRDCGASPHRGDAYAACRYAIERVKQIAPIWKREFFDGGDVWIEGATANPTTTGRGGRRAPGMRVTVRLFARLRDITGASELARELAPGATIGDVWRQLAGEFPELSRYERSISSAVNADYARMDQVHRRRGRDRVSPPVSGDRRAFDVRRSTARRARANDEPRTTNVNDARTTNHEHVMFDKLTPKNSATRI
jgi:molybdopterin synthase catalytic subunit/molybdopterin converting factor small subunit